MTDDPMVVISIFLVFVMPAFLGLLGFLERLRIIRGKRPLVIPQTLPGYPNIFNLITYRFLRPKQDTFLIYGVGYDTLRESIKVTLNKLNLTFEDDYKKIYIPEHNLALLFWTDPWKSAITLCRPDGSIFGYVTKDTPNYIWFESFIAELKEYYATHVVELARTTNMLYLIANAIVMIAPLMILANHFFLHWV